MDKEWLWLWVFPLASASGIAAMFDDEKVPLQWDWPTLRKVISVILNSGLCGMVVAYALLHYGTESAPLIVVVSILAGFGGNGTLRLLMSIFHRAIKGFSKRFFNEPSSGK
jgi:hypothetical protein